MSFLKFLFGGRAAHVTSPAKSGLGSERTWIFRPVDDGAMVDGRPTYEYGVSHKDDLVMMLRCCDAELEVMWRTNLPPAPGYAERAAIIYRRQGDFTKEIEVCERYLGELDRFLAVSEHASAARSSVGNTVQKLRDRIARAKVLQAKA